MMKREPNGFMTAYMLGIGLTVLSMATAASVLAFSYLQTAKQYTESIQLGYVAESAMILGWDDIRQRDWQQVPEKRTWKLADAYGVTQTGQHMEVQCVSQSYQLPYNGTVRGMGIGDASQMRRTGAVVFHVEKENEQVVFSVSQIRY